MDNVKQSQFLPCRKCGGEQVFNPKTEKVFCKAKCWLQNQPKETVVNVEVKSDDKNKSFKVAYAKDLAIAMIEACALLKVDFRDVEVMKAITDNSIIMVGAMWARL